MYTSEEPHHLGIYYWMKWLTDDTNSFEKWLLQCSVVEPSPFSWTRWVGSLLCWCCGRKHHHRDVRAHDILHLYSCCCCFGVVIFLWWGICLRMMTSSTPLLNVSPSHSSSLWCGLTVLHGLWWPTSTSPLFVSFCILCVVWVISTNKMWWPLTCVYVIYIDKAILP